MSGDDEAWFVGIDWASEKHEVCVLDQNGNVLGERTVPHSGDGLAELCDWMLVQAGGEVSAIHVSIEVPHGAVVETLLERGFVAYAINPKQLDRFRDRFTVAGDGSGPLMYSESCGRSLSRSRRGPGRLPLLTLLR